MLIKKTADIFYGELKIVLIRFGNFFMILRFCLPLIKQS